MMAYCNVECWLGSFENFRGTGPVLLRNSKFFRGGVRTPCPPSGSAHGTGQCIPSLRYTESPFYHAHRLLYDTLHTFYRMHKFLNETFFPEFHSGLIWIQTVFANVNKERKRERLVHAHPFGKIKVHRQIDK